MNSIVNIEKESLFYINTFSSIYCCTIIENERTKLCINKTGRRVKGLERGLKFSPVVFVGVEVGRDDHAIVELATR